MDQNFNLYGHYVKVIMKECLKRNYKRIFKKLDADQLRDIYEEDNELIFHQPFTCFFTPHIKGKDLILQAPDEDLARMKFEHWAYADAAFSLIQVYEFAGEKEAAEKQVYRFLATLYVPAGCDFDPQDVELVERQLKKAKLYPYEKTLILRSFGNCLNNIVERCPNIFPKPKAETDEVVPPVSRGPMWQELLFDLSHTPAFHGYDKAASANIFKALDYLELQAVRNKEKKK
jgi:hypothetical protein